ncbi:MAG TPA: DMT family transporter [Patescibacteria group bacterium]|nr:DMT family transporter [Patescibacteria group bacterium]
MDHAALFAVVFGLLTAVGWGFGDFWSAHATKKLGPITTLFYVTVVGLTAFGLLFVTVLRPHVTLTASSLWYTGVSSILVTIAAILFYKALLAGPVSLVSPITGAYPMVSTLLALLVFGAHISARQIAAIVVIVAGVLAASGLFNIKRNERLLSTGPLLAIFAIFFYGAGFTCMAQAVERIGWEVPLLLSCALSIPTLLLIYAKDARHIVSQAKQAFSNKYILGAGVMGTAAYAMLNISFTHDQAGGAIAIAVSSCYAALTMGLALKHFKEEIKLVPIAGAVVTIVGVVILALG